MAATDHVEVWFATNLVFEALVGELFRTGFVMRVGPACNDFVTPTVVSAAADDYRRNLANSLTLMKLLTSDTTHGADNRALMSGWLAKYVPLCVEAQRGLEAVWGMAPKGGVNFAASVADAQAHFKDILTELGVGLPAGVTL